MSGLPIAILLHPPHFPNLIAHASHTQHLTEMTPLPSRTLSNRFLHLDAISVLVLSLDQLHVWTIPMVAHQTTDQELRSDAVRFGE